MITKEEALKTLEKIEIDEVECKLKQMSKANFKCHYLCQICPIAMIIIKNYEGRCSYEKMRKIAKNMLIDIILTKELSE